MSGMTIKPLRPLRNHSVVVQSQHLKFKYVLEVQTFAGIELRCIEQSDLAKSVIARSCWESLEAFLEVFILEGLQTLQVRVSLFNAGILFSGIKAGHGRLYARVKVDVVE